MPPRQPSATPPPFGPAFTEPCDEFDWNDESLVVLREQPETAIYFNPEGSLVIRQRRYLEDDPYVVISAANINEFLDKLTEACGVPEMGRDGKL
jgi:hypothetical protein